ncbi:site-2 protease family protein [Herbaspirillum sp. RV1423]|uniref:site-2 protease family protein n=1 Tax=Herbaspirillum sp. RV1423 TaxID=1443993 RepID=UPI0004B21F55|nr:site-2 protease family protein [Herbaspirillum sp. RV1423]
MTPDLPPLREELSLMPGPPLVGGQPSWTLHDPVRNLFFQIDWSGFEILSRWALGQPAAIVDEVNAQTALQIGPEDVQDLALFLQQNQLLRPAVGAAPLLADMRGKQRKSWGEWLLHNYLFLRLPLVRPDRWLSRWSPRLNFFYSKLFFRLTLAAALLGLLGVYRQWEQFAGTLVDHFTWQGLAAYGATLIAIKTLHELGHGFTAKRHGCRVPSMGVALLVLWPVAYTDTNEVWKLSERRQRLEIAGAGIATELIIAAWATLAWVVLPDGLPRAIAFLLSTTTWISTLLINASPFMRFDGYFLLSDYLQIPNLHSRSFALARWDLRERLFAVNEPVPEHLPQRLHKGMVLFAWAVWIYRLTVFLGVAALVYHFFIKAAGIFLFMIEIGWFVLMPLRQELLAWRQRWPQIRQRRRYRRSAIAAIVLMLIFALPWPTRITTSGMLQPVRQLELYAPSHAQIGALPATNGSTVAAEAPLLVMKSPDLIRRNQQNEARQEQLSWQSNSASFDVEARKNWQLLNEQLASTEAEQATVDADMKRYQPVAPYAGKLEDLDPDLRPGQWLSQGESLGRLIGDGPWQVVTYVDEDDIHRLAPGDRAVFIADGLAGPNLHLELLNIDKNASPTLSEGPLASMFGGHVAVREKKGILYPERAIYRVVLSVRSDGPITQHSWRGRVTFAARWEAPGLRFLKTAVAVFWREAGF